MGRFIRDFGFLGSLLLLPLGIYGIWLGTDSRGPNASSFLIVGAAATAGGVLGLCTSIREHFILRDHVRYAHGRPRNGMFRRLPRT